MKHEDLDVVIIGAGLSGVGAAVHLQKKCPGKTFALLEMRAAMGGTWDLFRYPGIRSDSDMYTLGYAFKPWSNPKSIADGPDIRAYIEETAREYGVADKVRYRHKVLGLDWSSRDARWTITVERLDTGEVVTLTARYVIACSGYYRYEAGHTPEFAGRDDFRGTIVHPQAWPEDLDYANKRVVVIGSGATAVTLVPALAEKAAHVTMLQRSPGYVVSVPGRDILSNGLRRILPERAVYGFARVKN
ncbi:MAG: NAD(P)/FAD-dependent oxidoreductase, partial [Polyangiales bacterium]